ncbi:MAG: hypothetical protein JWM74_2035 [Myxococcaceae bacterium]|nr:hypothetical protein [Myxococcaceae bacterium]
MDPLTAILCALGAMAVAQSTASDAFGAFVLGAGLYGLHRATQKGIARVLIAAPALIWILGNFWRVLPDGMRRFNDGMLGNAPGHLATFILFGVFLAVVALARSRIGSGLAALTMGALGFAMFVKFIALFTESNTTAGVVITEIASGWGHVGRVLTALCWLVLGLGPVATPALPRATGAMVGAVGAALLASVVFAGGGGSGGYDPSVVQLSMMLALFLGWVLSTFGLGALARAGAGPVAWVGVGLIVVQIVFGLPSAAFLEESMGRSGWALPITGMPLGLLGIALTALSARSIQLHHPRNLAAVLLLVAMLGAMQLWFSAMLMALRVFRRGTPGWPVELLSRPAMTLGLVLWAACLAYLALPPVGQSSERSST